MWKVTQWAEYEYMYYLYIGAQGGFLELYIPYHKDLERLQMWPQNKIHS